MIKTLGYILKRSFMLGILSILAGLFMIVAAALNWGRLMDNKRAAVFVRLFGRNGARVFYVFLGVGLVALGYMILS
jgi:hypothetical protein